MWLLHSGALSCFVGIIACPAVGLLECDWISAVDQLLVLMIEVPLGNRAAGCLCLQGVQQHASCCGKSLGDVGSDPDAWSFCSLTPISCSLLRTYRGIPP